MTTPRPLDSAPPEAKFQLVILHLQPRASQDPGERVAFTVMCSEERQEVF